MIGQAPPPFHDRCLFKSRFYTSISFDSVFFQLTKKKKRKERKNKEIMEIIIDLQGFIIGNNNFILKEYAAASVQSADRGKEIVTHGIFKPPCSCACLNEKDIKRNTWLTTHYHGLSWDIGEFEYKYVRSEFQNLLEEERVKKIYIKGLQKEQWLRQFIPSTYDILNLEDLGCPKLGDLKFYARYKHFNIHQQTETPGGECSCALDNVGRLKAWFERNWGVWEKPGVPDAPSLLNMDPEDMVFLRPDFLCRTASNIYIDAVWDKLPDHLKEDRRVANYRRCSKHFNSQSDVIDGPVPIVKDCPMCQKEKKK